MTAVATAAPGFVPGAAPDLSFLGSLTDPGTWRTRGVTHWHLVASEIGTADQRRYTMERVQRLEHIDYVGAATDPRDALVWLAEQFASALDRSSDPAGFARRRGWHTREDWKLTVLHHWDTLTRMVNVPVGGGMAVRDGWSVEIYAYPMTKDRCRKTH